jgi:branched-chain amino acid transport system substrate-binding protein
MQGFGAMNPTAVKEASKIGYPMNRFVGNWWAGSDDDARPTGAEAKGYSSLDLNAVGTNFPAIQDIIKYVVDKGKSQVASKDKVGENFYNRAVFNSVIIAEAIRTAQRLTNKKQVNGEDVRRGFEALDISAARLKEIGLENFASPVKVSCSDHNGHGGISVVEWDGTKWNTSVASIQPIKDKVLPLIENAAQDYVKANAGWPKRTEPCDKSS